MQAEVSQIVNLKGIPPADDYVMCLLLLQCSYY